MIKKEIIVHLVVENDFFYVIKMYGISSITFLFMKLIICGQLFMRRNKQRHFKCFVQILFSIADRIWVKLK